MRRSLFVRARARRRTPAWVPLLFSAALVAVDRISKLLVDAHMTLGQDIPVLGPFLHLYYVRNDGAAFSLLRGMQWVLIPFTCAMVAVCVWVLLTRRVRSKLGRFALALLIGGGVGNLIDRVAAHEVIDFLYIKIINFAIFNLADSFVVVGVVLLCLSIFLEDRR